MSFALQNVQPLLRMDEDAERIAHRQWRQGIVLDHVIQPDLIVPKGLGVLTTHATIIPLMLSDITSAVVPLIPKNTGEEILEAEVVENDDAWMPAAHLPDRRVKPRVIAEMVDADIGAVEVHPGEMIDMVAPHFGHVFKACIPFTLVGPQYDLGPFSQGREEPRCISSDPTLGRG